MRYIPKLYLETTIFNFYFAGKGGKKQQDTIKMFEAIKKRRYEAFVSVFVYREISRATSFKFRKMKFLIDNYTSNILGYNQEIMDLANEYINNGIIPPKYIDDALHIAVASVNKLDFVVSFNMGHIVTPKTMIGTGFINLDH